MRIFLLSGLFFLLFTASAQQFNFIHYSVEHNLAQSQVTDICQDKNGYLWIGTESGGISRFDGIAFTNFSMDDGLADNKIENLFIDSQDRMWVATLEGLSCYENRIFTPYYFPEPLRINDIAEFQGEIFLASNTGLVRFSDGQFERIVLTDEEDLYLRSIENYKDSILLCGGKSGLLTWKNEAFSPLKNPDLGDKNILDVQVLNESAYISAHREGIYVYNFTTGRISQIPIEFTRIRAMHVDEKGILGVSIGYGAFSLDEQDLNIFDEQSGLLTNNLNCIFRDAENNIWIGTDGKGLLKFSGRSVVFYSTKDSLSSPQIVSITQDTSNSFIFGTYGAGVTVLPIAGAVNYWSRETGLSDNTVWSLSVDQQNRTWVGTARGINLVKDGEILSHPMKDVPTKVRTIAIINDTTVLFGGDEGIFALSGSTYSNYHKTFNVYQLLYDGKQLFCGGTNGLFLFRDPHNLLAYEEILLPENAINTLATDQSGNLWIGTENGLFVRSPEGQILPFPLDREQHNSKTILGLIVNHENDVWVSTMNGVYEIIPLAPERLQFDILHYGIAEGLIDLECNGNAIYEDHMNRIWVGTSSGLARIDPELNEELFDFKAPILHITGLRLFMEEFNYESYNAEIDEETGIPISITLPHNKNHLTFDFIGINLKDPKSVRYEYRLIGTNDMWSPMSETRYATYSFLQPGDYEFQVRARSKNGAISDIKSIQLTILPPFWRTWWFIMLLILAALALIITIFQFRIRAIKQKQENERLGFKNRLLFLEQQSLNASMNRHFIFNSLNSIQYFINSSDKISANKYLSSFAKLIRKNLDSSSANNFIVTLQEEMERIELYLSLEKMRFSGKFDYQIEMGAGIDVENIEIPSMILQPFVENSIIHGVLPVERKGLIIIRIFEEFGELVFEVIDDGIGIDNSLNSKKDASSGDHKSQGMDITSRRIDLIRKLTGEKLMIIGPFQMNDEEGNCLGTKVIIKMSIEAEE